MKILILDIETSPSVAHVWGLFNQTVSLSQLQQSTQVIAFAAKWYQDKRVLFYSDYHNGHDQMVEAAHDLVDQADAVVHYNGTRFDMPHLRREFLLAGMTPPSPVQEIDLLRTMRGQFRFISNKLQHVSQELDIGSKTKHSGHDLWVRCMAGDSRAWTQMRRYNKQDVLLTEQLYDRVKPWIKGHPHVGLHAGLEHACSNCGSSDLRKEGLAPTQLGMYQRYQCKQCGKFSRGAKALMRVDERGTA